MVSSDTASIGKPCHFFFLLDAYRFNFFFVSSLHHIIMTHFTPTNVHSFSVYPSVDVCSLFLLQVIRLRILPRLSTVPTKSRIQISLFASFLTIFQPFLMGPGRLLTMSFDKGRLKLQQSLQCSSANTRKQLTCIVTRMHLLCHNRTTRK